MKAGRLGGQGHRRACGLGGHEVGRACEGHTRANTKMTFYFESRQLTEAPRKLYIISNVDHICLATPFCNYQSSIKRRRIEHISVYISFFYQKGAQSHLQKRVGLKNVVLNRIDTKIPKQKFKLTPN